MLLTIPVRSRNDCGALKSEEAEIRSEAKWRVRKSRAEQDDSTSRNNNGARFRVLGTIEFAAREPGLASGWTADGACPYMSFLATCDCK